MTTQTEISIDLIQACFESEHFPKLFSGKDTHDPALRFVGQIVRFTEDADFIHAIVKSGLPQDYAGNTLNEVNGMVESAMKKGFDAPAEGRKGQKSPSSKLLDLIEQMDEVELFHDASDVPFISIKKNGKGCVTYPLASRAAVSWLKGLYYRRFRKPLPTQALTEVQGTLEAKAIFDSLKKEIHLRIARHENSIVYNLGDDAGHVVIVDQNGYRITTDSPVAFVRSTAMRPLPLPEKKEGLYGLRKFQEILNLPPVTFHRVLAFIINCLNPEGPYFFLLVEGEQGSGKSFLGELIKLLIDPYKAPKLRPPSSERDLMIQAAHNHLLVFDNVSGFRADMSDALCSLSTGGGYATRKLYSDGELEIFSECRPYILNGINGVANRPDLLERSISVKLLSFTKGRRKSEKEILPSLRKLHPYLLSDLLDIMSCALRNFDEVIPPSQFRMLDAAQWILAAEPATGLPEGFLLDALEGSQTDVIVESMSNNSLAMALAKYIEKGAFEGTIGELYNRLEEYRSKYDRSFPPTSAHLSRTLERLRPALLKAGVVVEFGEKTRKGKMVSVCFAENGILAEAQEASSTYGILM